MSIPAILAIDQGTTSSRAIAFDLDSNIIAMSQQPFTQIYPRTGWVEHNPEDIWSTTLKVIRETAARVDAGPYRICAAGIANQRETTLVWDRENGQPIYNAIVWQDRRTAARCQTLDADGLSHIITSGTGLLIDPYFSATKVAWILDHVPGARQRAADGRLAFGTVDSFLIWRLTGGRVHATDATNASRTSLFNIHTNTWDEDLLRIFNVPKSVLPEVLDSSGNYGDTLPEIMGRSVPISGVAGDQQAATIGQCCFRSGQIKSTYGTGCFVLMNTGSQVVQSGSRLLSTIAYCLDGKNTYALEGTIFIAGAAVQWLRDNLGIIASASDTEALAANLENNRGVYMVPAFTGLGAPHWQPDARGAILGLGRDTGPAELVRAALESVAYQTWDLLAAMADDGVHPTVLKVDGGMSANNWLMQFLADITTLTIQRPEVMETTALGVAYLAGLHTGLFESLESISAQRRCHQQFHPAMKDRNQRALLSSWHDAVNRTIGQHLQKK
jgi:glycerol kinase